MTPGFGALLGTMKNLDDSYATFISGLYLGFDAMSSILAIIFKDLVFVTDGKDPEDKGAVVCAFFVTLGCIIGAVGFAAGLMYLIFGTKDEEEEQEEQDPQHPAYRPSHASINDDGRRRSSLFREAELMSMQRVAKSDQVGGFFRSRVIVGFGIVWDQVVQSILKKLWFRHVDSDGRIQWWGEVAARSRFALAVDGRARVKRA